MTIKIQTSTKGCRRRLATINSKKEKEIREALEGTFAVLLF
jgi:hypothetical protein